MRRLLVLKHIIDLFQTLNLSTEITTELTGLLLNEVLSCFAVYFCELINVLIPLKSYRYHMFAVVVMPMYVHMFTVVCICTL